MFHLRWAIRYNAERIDQRVSTFMVPSIHLLNKGIGLRVQMPATINCRTVKAFIRVCQTFEQNVKQRRYTLHYPVFRLLAKGKDELRPFVAIEN